MLALQYGGSDTVPLMCPISEHIIRNWCTNWPQMIKSFRSLLLSESVCYNAEHLPDWYNTVALGFDEIVAFVVMWVYVFVCL